MTRRRAGDVYRDLAVRHQESASLLLELASIAESTVVVSDDAETGRKRRPPTIVRPVGESDELSRRRAEKILRNNGLVRR
jgi:hypothetical protein